MQSKPATRAIDAPFYGNHRRWRVGCRDAAKFSVVLLCVVLIPQAHLFAEARANDADNHFTGFEEVNAGRFDRLVTNVGTWSATTGQFAIDSKLAKNGKHCLQLPGPNSIVELKVEGDYSTADELSFAAERWTARGPFTFRIEKLTGDTWTEIFNGDSYVRVGRGFLSNVKVPLGSGIAHRLRFIVTSPANTGVLIDDLRIAPAKPQTIVDVQVVPTTLPVLVGASSCPLVKLRIETTGSLDPVHVKAMKTTLVGTDVVSDIDSVHVVSTGASESFGGRHASAKGPWVKASLEPMSVDFGSNVCVLAEGIQFVWVACQLKASADIDHRVGATCQAITFSNGQTFRLKNEPSAQRMGIALRNGGDDGVNTYRIPGLAKTNRGSLIAVYDVRYRNGGDLPGDIDVGMSRSLDGGRTWEPMRIIMDMGNDPAHRYDGIGDPAVLVDRVNGTIWVAGLWSHGNRGWNGSGQGTSPEKTGQLLLVRSDDDGVTWSKPINITAQVKQPDWCLLLQGPGKGITMQDGTLVFAAQYQDPPNNKRLPHSTIIYSTDRGETWQIGTGAYGDTTEAQVVESQPGVLMLNCRYNRAASRVVMTSSDLGKTWNEHSTSQKALIEPYACMASLIDVASETNKASGWLLFSNPNSTRQRNHITIKGSPDRGLSWPAEHQVLLDEGLGGGYSCMTMIDDSTIGIVYEGSQSHLTFQRISLNDVQQPAAPK